MKVTVTQVYEMTVSIQVAVPDGWDEVDLYNALEDFPLSATIQVGEVDGEIIVDSFSLDSVVSLSGATTITDENGEEL